MTAEGSRRSRVGAGLRETNEGVALYNGIFGLLLRNEVLLVHDLDGIVAVGPDLGDGVGSRCSSYHLDDQSMPKRQVSELTVL